MSEKHVQLFRRSFLFVGIPAVLWLLVACGQPGYHMVRPGETLYSVSWRYALDYQQLAVWNGISPPYITKPGQWLRLLPPAAGSANKRLPVTANRQTSAPVTIKKTIVAASTATTAKAPAMKVARMQRPLESTAGHSRQQRGAGEIHWSWPAQGSVIQGFRSRARGIIGQGLDIAGKEGSPVHSAAAGQVVYSGQGIASYGHLLIIKHNDDYLSAYAHNQRLLVREGEHVRAGQQIARMGKSGAAAQQVKLHFEIRRKGQPVDPMKYLPEKHP